MDIFAYRTLTSSIYDEMKREDATSVMLLQNLLIRNSSCKYAKYQTETPVSTKEYADYRVSIISGFISKFVEKQNTNIIDIGKFIKLLKDHLKVVEKSYETEQLLKVMLKAKKEGATVAWISY